MTKVIGTIKVKKNTTCNISMKSSTPKVTLTPHYVKGEIKIPKLL